MKEEDTSELEDAFKDNERILNAFIKDASDLVDIIHGNAQLPERVGFADGTYTSDVSPYVIGWILGIEWDPNFMLGTIKNNPDRKTYEGKYLYTDNATPFEVFLCEVGDTVIGYELDKYGIERPISFSNWPTTDMLSHPNEPYEHEDMVSFNIEHIKTRETFEPGMFASYHIYPYYPEFMNYQKEYITFQDDNGHINTYKAYLRDLMNHHTIPVLVAEFGIPASRGNAHNNVHMGYNQGHHDEKEQGLIVETLLQDIYDEGYCGGLVFSWQDEWFKRTWNTMAFDLSDRRPFWSNTQTNEQEFGLLAFDPGLESTCYVDGDVSEWEQESPVYTGKDVDLYVKSDEKYLYLMADTTDFDFDTDTLIIPIDTLPGQGNTEDITNKMTFSRPADFVVQISGKTNSRIMVDAYYDSFEYMYQNQLKHIKIDPFHEIKGSGMFNPMHLCLSRGILLPEDNIEIPFEQYETGLFRYGNANPQAKDTNSLSDFCEKDGKIEIRIPWHLLNIMDPSTKSVMGNLHDNPKLSPNKTPDISPEKINGFYFGAGISGKVQTHEAIGMNLYSWEEWEQPTFHERLKPSYYILKDAFERIK